MGHYDIDIKCKKCGKYMFSVFTCEGLEKDFDLCDDCHPDKDVFKQLKEYKY